MDEPHACDKFKKTRHVVVGESQSLEIPGQGVCNGAAIFKSPPQIEKLRPEKCLGFYRRPPREPDPEDERDPDDGPPRCDEPDDERCW